jgi:hypothetical protein
MEENCGLIQSLKSTYIWSSSSGVMSMKGKRVLIICSSVRMTCVKEELHWLLHVVFCPASTIQV